MKNKSFRLISTLALGALLVGGALAQGKMKPKPKAVECPVCHMPLSAKKTKADPIAVRLKNGGKVMYCCAGCKMPDSVLVKPAKAKGKKK